MSFKIGNCRHRAPTPPNHGDHRRQRSQNSRSSRIVIRSTPKKPRPTPTPTGPDGVRIEISTDNGSADSPRNQCPASHRMTIIHRSIIVSSNLDGVLPSNAIRVKKRSVGCSSASAALLDGGCTEDTLNNTPSNISRVTGNCNRKSPFHDKTTLSASVVCGDPVERLKKSGGHGGNPMENKRNW